MYPFAFAVLLMLSLPGCVTKQPYGNFAKNFPALYNQKVADDAVNQLMAIYPPARTRFNLLHLTSDPFGTSLIELLRAKGYAIFEFEAQTARSSITATPASGLPLRYILDQIPNSALYRMTLLLGDQSLTRAYGVQNDKVYPAGAWIHKE